LHSPATTRSIGGKHGTPSALKALVVPASPAKISTNIFTPAGGLSGTSLHELYTTCAGLAGLGTVACPFASPGLLVLRCKGMGSGFGVLALAGASSGDRLIGTFAPSWLGCIGTGKILGFLTPCCSAAGFCSPAGLKIVGLLASPGFWAASVSAGTWPFPASFAGPLPGLLVPFGPQLAVQVDNPCVLPPHFTHQCSNLHTWWLQPLVQL
jgi:hypothetical protein